VFFCVCVFLYVFFEVVPFFFNSCRFRWDGSWGIICLCLCAFCWFVHFSNWLLQMWREMRYSYTNIQQTNFDSRLSLLIEIFVTTICFLSFRLGPENDFGMKNRAVLVEVEIDKKVILVQIALLWIGRPNNQNQSIYMYI